MVRALLLIAKQRGGLLILIEEIWRARSSSSEAISRYCSGDLRRIMLCSFSWVNSLSRSWAKGWVVRGVAIAGEGVEDDGWV